MKPVSVSVTVPTGRADVYGFLDVLANHEGFTNHMLVDWSYAGPSSGVGARARMRVKKPGRADWINLEVTDAQPPRGSTEESVSAAGRRRTRGTYSLEELPEGGTRITFELAWLQIPLIERLAAPITRAVVRRVATRDRWIGSASNSAKAIARTRVRSSRDCDRTPQACLYNGDEVLAHQTGLSRRCAYSRSNGGVEPLSVAPGHG